MPEEARVESAGKKIPVNEITIRPLVRADVAKLPKLFLECLGRHSPESWLEWKFFGSPHEGAVAFIVAYHGDDLVAFIGANGVPFAMDGEFILVYQHQDTAIREDCRNLALLRAMLESSEQQSLPDERIRLTYSITTPHMRALVTKRMKYTVVWEGLKMVKLTSLRGMAAKATRWPRLAALLPGPIGRSWKAPGSMTGDIRRIERFGPEFDVFWKEAMVPGGEGTGLGRIFPWQDAAWLNYKFCQDEMVEFSKFAYIEAGRVLGYVVLNVTQLDVRIGYIDSLWTVPGRDDLTELLTGFGVAELRRAGCDQVSCWTRTNAPVGRALGKMGFVQRPTPQCLSVKQLKGVKGDLGLKGEHWNLQRGHTYYTSLGHLQAEEGTQRLYKAKEQRDADRSERLRGKAEV